MKQTSTTKANTLSDTLNGVIRIDLEDDYCCQGCSMLKTELDLADLSILGKYFAACSKIQGLEKRTVVLHSSNARILSQAEICKNKDGSILSDGRDLIEMWMKHYDEYLNGIEAQISRIKRNEENSSVVCVF